MACITALANQDPEKGNKDMSPIQFLPFPQVMEELESSARRRVSPSVISELKNAYDKEWFSVRLAMTIYANFLV